MSELRPYHTKPDAPLTAGARFIRGFTRIGTIAAVLVALIGIVSSFYNASSEYDYAKSQFKNANCVANIARTGYTFKLLSYSRTALDYEAAGCDNLGLYDKPIAAVLAIASGAAPSILDAAQSFGIGLIVTGIIAIIAFVGFRVIGWLFAGFTRDA
jgi:hypothetical protein